MPNCPGINTLPLGPHCATKPCTDIIFKMKRMLYSSPLCGRFSRKLPVLAIMVLHLTSCSATDQLAPVYRLPSTVTPLKYMLRLEPDLDNNTVSGVVMIELITTSIENGTDSMNKITLHLGEDSRVNETNVLLIDSIGVFVKNLSVVYNDDYTSVDVVLPSGSTLAYNRIYMLSLPFTSPLYDEAIGLFTGYFTSTSKYVASNFRATFARNVFPCFDEPQFQVPLTLQVLRPASYNVTFTAALHSSVASDNDTMLDTFESTGNISLSSLGLFMSEVMPVKGMDLNIYAPDGYNSSVTFLEDLLSNINNTLGPFPSTNTLNLVVLPDRLYKSFSSLGFVFTTPEVYNDEVEAELQRRVLRQQLAEAFLQQYLAFSKTPSWWSDLWLSDSLAAFLALQMLPEASLEGLQATLMRKNGLNSDYISCSGPVVDKQLFLRLDIETALYKQIIKNKGLSILTMWRDTLPEGVLSQTIYDFINLNKSLTSTDDFLELLTANINKSGTTYNVTAIVDYLSSWIYASGNPVVTLMWQNIANITISQTSDCSNLVSSLWPISISYTNESSTNWTNIQQGLWLLDSNLTLPTNESGWTVINLENAPYMVNYGSSYQQILAALTADNSSSIPADVRASIQADAVALALTGSLDFDTALSVLNNTQHEQVDWVPVVSALDTLSALVGTGEWGLEELGMYVETLFSTNLLSALDLRNNSNNPEQWLARALLTPTLCRFYISTCRTAVLELSQLLFLDRSTNQIDPNDVDNVACLGARYNTSAVDVLLAGYTNATSLADKRLFVLALSCVVTTNSVQKILNVVNGSLSRTQNSTESLLLTADSSPAFTVRETRDILVGLASSVENSETIMDFIVSEAVALEATIGSGYLSDVIKTLAKSRVDLTKLQSLSETDLNLGVYTKQSIVEAVSKANFTSTWWSSYGQALLKSMPQLPATASPSTEDITTRPTSLTIPTTAAASTSNATSATEGSTPSVVPNSAAHCTNTQIFSLIVATILLTISISF